MFDHFSTLYMKGLNYFSNEPEAMSIIWTAQTSKLIIVDFQTTKSVSKNRNVNKEKLLIQAIWNYGKYNNYRNLYWFYCFQNFVLSVSGSVCSTKSMRKKVSQGKKFWFIFFIKVISRKTKLLKIYSIQKLFQSNFKRKKNGHKLPLFKKKFFYQILIFGLIWFFLKNFMGIPVTVVWE